MIEATFRNLRRVHQAMPLDLLMATLALRLWIDRERARIRHEAHRQYVLGPA